MIAFPEEEPFLLNMFGEGEEPGFRDVTVDGRPDTFGGTQRANTSEFSSASQIVINSAPMTDANAIPELLRLSESGTSVTYRLPAPDPFEESPPVFTLNSNGMFPWQQDVLDAYGDRVQNYTVQEVTKDYPSGPIQMIQLQITIK
jgi:hypothetical protein